MDEQAWEDAHQDSGGVTKNRPKTAVIVTNTGSDRTPDGTPILAVTANWGKVLVQALSERQQFIVDFDAQTIDLKGRDQNFRLAPLTDSQKVMFEVDFGGQFSS